MPSRQSSQIRNKYSRKAQQHQNQQSHYFSGQRKHSRQRKLLTSLMNHQQPFAAREDKTPLLGDRCHVMSLPEESHRIPLTNTLELQLRFLNPSDLPEVKSLCKEWFPIDYPDDWYNDITSSHKFYSVACVYKTRIIGLVVAEIKDYFKLPKEDSDILASTFRSGTKIGYILSLGVVKEFRKNGVASFLLDNLISHLTSPENEGVKAVYLHVLTTNFQAISFYEHRGFRPHVFLPFYYNIKGKRKDGFTYVLYINNGHPPWSLLEYIVHCCQMVFLLNPWSLTRQAMRKANLAWLRIMAPRIRRIASQSSAAVFS